MWATMFGEVLRVLEDGPDDSPGITRYVVAGSTTDNAAKLLLDNKVQLVDATLGEPPTLPPDTCILCSAQMLCEVMEAWCSWRPGRQPPTHDAAEALMWYLAHDAFMPVEADTRTQ